MLLYYSNVFNFYTETETDNSPVSKVTNIGDIPLPGHLYIGTPGYTSSRPKCNAEVGGYTRYAELRAYNSYEMYLNLSTAKTDGAWMYFKSNNDDYIQLPSSDNKVNTYKDIAISVNLDVGATSNNSTKAHEQELLMHMLNLKLIMVTILIGISKMVTIPKHGLTYQ